MRKLVSIIIVFMLLAGMAMPAGAVSPAEIEAAVRDAAEYMLEAVKSPQVSSIGGEWAVMGLARCGYDVPDSYYEGYYRTVEKYVRDCEGVLHSVKYTEYSRVVLALTAAGYDPRDVAGYDLTAPLEDFDKTIWQGINGPVFALLALDSVNYQNSWRGEYVAEILRRQLDDGGWNLNGGVTGATRNQPSDPDMTGMVLQALAKYQDMPEVKSATEKALAFLSEKQNSEGGYSSVFSSSTTDIESAVQALVALCELGIPVDDERFVKDGNTLVDNILSYKNADGSYWHTHDDGGSNQMATEQALYGLAAAQRAAQSAAGKTQNTATPVTNSLYRMDDAVKRGKSAGNHTDSEHESTHGMPGKHPDVNFMPVEHHGKAFADTTDHPEKTAIEMLAERAIINGKSETEFAPDATMTRAEFAAIVTRGLGLMQNPESAAQNSFEDVDSNAWYYEYVITAAYYEIVRGVSESQFAPHNTITRQEAAVMTARAARLCGIDTSRGETQIRNTLAQFTDYRSAAGWAQESLAFCYDTGILDDSVLNISPAEHVSRGEIAGMLYRMLDAAWLI